MQVKGFICGPLGANCYVVCDERTRKGFMVDPGGTSSKMEAYIKEEKIEIQCIILTHGHGDHIGGVSHYREMYQAKVVASLEEKELLGDASLNLSKHTLGKGIELAADQYVEDGDTLTVGNLELKFITTPGHTPGGMCILAEDCLFSGDTLFSQSVGRTDFPRSSFEKLSRSIREKLYLLPDNTTVFPGHMGETTIGIEKEYNPFV